ncbi:hypothetical protein, partial [Polymorphobacter sp.]|uniref:hypothetical protein n=1 Tax=Polymorphobacter sp. TaxID=1909290 RepID=UPI003F6EE276
MTSVETPAVETPAGAGPETRGAKTARLLHLDALRAFCMFFGVLVHGSTIDFSARPLFEGVREASDL